MLNVIGTIGIPGCGKSFFAKQFIIDNPDWLRINRDDLRSKIGGPYYDGMDNKIESQVMKERNRLILEALDKGKNFIVDEIFLSPKSRKTLEGMVAGKAIVEWKEFTDISIEECIRRDATRTGRWQVGEKIIRMMYNNWKKGQIEEEQKPKVYDPTLQFCIICDMDGTLSLINIKAREHYDTAKAIDDFTNIPIVDIVNNSQYPIFIVTSREERHRRVTEEWLEARAVCYQALIMKDNGDRRPDIVTKKEMYDKYFKDKWNVMFVLEARKRVVQMYRKELGLTVLQVSDGNY